MKQRPIRLKFLFCLALLLILVVTLAGTGLVSLSLYSNVVSNLGWRAEILPVAADLSTEVDELRIAFNEIQRLNQYIAKFKPFVVQVLGRDLTEMQSLFEAKLNGFGVTLEQYLRLLRERGETETEKGQLAQEFSTLNEIQAKMQLIQSSTADPQWGSNSILIDETEQHLAELRKSAGQLPKFQLAELAQYSSSVKSRYRALFSLFIVLGIGSGILLAVLIRLGYLWVFQPLSVLIAGSREIASGRFQHRIKLQTRDEMSELANALNEMTERFETVRTDLDEKVRLRSQEAVRNERLASVGFLAAGVAHEINNPLASIAMCAESLDRRLQPILRDREAESTRSGPAPADGESDVEVVRRYLNMIQSEAFRCKGITEKLLDFSRTEKSDRRKTDLKALIFDMVEMIAHHGDYREKEVRLNMPEPVFATVNSQEMKQVVLNLLTNALDSISPGGTVRVRLSESDGFARITVEDDGCGMSPDVLNNVFEPFFTRRKQGQGTGLGLSITHRIITDHEGRIEAQSPGVGRGSTFRVEVPIGC